MYKTYNLNRLSGQSDLLVRFDFVFYTEPLLNLIALFKRFKILNQSDKTNQAGSPDD